MHLTRPAYIRIDAQDKRTLRFYWDDARASRDFTHDPAWVRQAAEPLSLRARMALCVGLYEWTVWRFDGLHNDERPLQIVEAAWCATLHPARLQFFELERHEWLGPVRGPLWCGATWLHPAVAEGDRSIFHVEDALSYLTRLAFHIQPRPQPLKDWLEAVLPRLAALFPAPAYAPWDDLFDRRLIERRGPLVAPQALDPALPYAIEEGERQMRQFAGAADPRRNPFLAPGAPPAPAA